VAAVGWHAAGGPALTLETEKRLQAPLRVRGGVEVALKKKIFVRTGFSLQPLTLTVGIGIRTTRVRLDFASTYLSAFSLFHQASVAYRLSLTSRS
jgi:hypothetical protein